MKPCEADVAFKIIQDAACAKPSSKQFPGAVQSAEPFQPRSPGKLSSLLGSDLSKAVAAGEGTSKRLGLSSFGLLRVDTCGLLSCLVLSRRHWKSIATGARQPLTEFMFEKLGYFGWRDDMAWKAMCNTGQNLQADVDIAASKEHFQTVAYERAVRVRVPLVTLVRSMFSFSFSGDVLRAILCHPFQMGTAHELDDQPVREVSD